MAINRIRLDASLHARFLAEERKDPITKEPLCAGMDIVICANDKIAFLLESWANECPFCHGIETLRDVPRSVQFNFGRRRPTARIHRVATNNFQNRDQNRPANIVINDPGSGIKPKHVIIGIFALIILIWIISSIGGNNVNRSEQTVPAEFRVIKTVIGTDVTGNQPIGVSDTFVGSQNKLVSFTTYEGAIANKTSMVFQWYRNNSHFVSCNPFTVQHANGFYHCTANNQFLEGNYEGKLLVDGIEKDKISFIVKPESEIVVSKSVVAEEVDSANRPVGVGTSFQENNSFGSSKSGYVVYFVEYQNAIPGKTEFSVKWLKEGQVSGLVNNCRKTIQDSSGVFICKSGDNYWMNLLKGNYEVLLEANGKILDRLSFEIVSRPDNEIQEGTEEQKHQKEVDLKRRESEDQRRRLEEQQRAEEFRRQRDTEQQRREAEFQQRRLERQQRGEALRQQREAERYRRQQQRATSNTPPPWTYRQPELRPRSFEPPAGSLRE